MLIFYDFLMFNFDHVQCQNEFDFPKVGAPTHDFAKFSQKLHEIERIWTTAGGAHPPPLRYTNEVEYTFTDQIAKNILL